MQSTTKLSEDDMSKFLSSLFGFEVNVYYMVINNNGEVEVEWEKVEQ